ncbi:hypothetical protein ACQKWADRAFT_330772 [Trichoderma austrokoningii]
MATTDNEVTRVYRDAETWNSFLQRCVDNINYTRRQILALDEVIFAGNANHRPLPPNSPETFQRASLYHYWRNATWDLQVKRQLPYAPLDLQTYLESLHSIDLEMPARDMLDWAPDAAPQPTWYPQSIEPSTQFAAKQLDVWHELASSFSLRHEACFPSLAHLEWEQRQGGNRIVGCSQSLLWFMKGTVDGPVERILDHIVKDPHLVDSLGVKDIIRYDDYHRPYLDIERSELWDGMSVVFTHRSSTPGLVRRVSTVLVSCHRPPSRLSLQEILRGLRGGTINVWREVIQHRLATSFSAMSKFLVVAVITGLFDEMIRARTRFGYICTGEALIFLEMTADLMSVRYSICVPRVDVESDVVTGLHRTAAAQVLAFTLRALRAAPIPPEEYVEASRKLWTWNMNVDNLFNKIPPVMRKQRLNTPHVPENWRPFLQASPIEPRDDYLFWPGRIRRDNEADFNALGVFDFLSSEPVDPAGQHIWQRPFCSAECLWGIERARGLDRACPNFGHHGDRHILPLDLLVDLTTQLDTDLATGNVANFRFLRRSGRFTALFKVRLESRGYTLLLKGAFLSKVDRLRHEVDMYDSLLSLQGSSVPVCFGLIHTQLPIVRYHEHYSDFMVFGGFSEGVMPLNRCLAAGVDRQEIVTAVDEAFRQIHAARVLHFDPEPRNMLYDAARKRAVVADFERAVHDNFEGQQLLDAIVMVRGVVDNLQPRRRRIGDRDFEMERKFKRSLEGDSHDVPAPKRQATLNQFMLLAAPALTTVQVSEPATPSSSALSRTNAQLKDLSQDDALLAWGRLRDGYIDKSG